MVELGIVLALGDGLYVVAKRDERRAVQLVAHGRKSVAQDLDRGDVEFDLGKGKQIFVGRALGSGGHAAQLADVGEHGQHLDKGRGDLGHGEHIREDLCAVVDDGGVGGKVFTQRAVFQFDELGKTETFGGFVRNRGTVFRRHVLRALLRRGIQQAEAECRHTFPFLYMGS